MTESGLLSARGPLPLTQAVPGNLSTGPSGPARPPYGRAGRCKDGPEARSAAQRRRRSILSGIHIPAGGKGSTKYVQSHSTQIAHIM